MRKIQRLPDHIIAQIAAGEVIERPAYAVKELVENAIDAKATHITIYFEEAGLKKLMISDNGEGMAKDDLHESFKHHTTSKLSADENFLGIKSLGFRGEALSSIASVSTLKIKSKTAEDTAGCEIEIEKGETKHISSIGMPTGTTVTVYDLFSAVPARKKFLKSIRTESRHILEIVLKIALANPEIRFTLQNKDKTLFDFPISEEKYERIKRLLGYDVFQQMVPIEFTDPYITITGFITKPHFVSTTQKQYVFINNRSVQEKLLNQAVKAGYQGLLESDAYPIFVLFITVPYEMVDVNVHPQKETVHLVDERQAMKAIEIAVRETLKKYNITPTLLPWKNMPNFATDTLRDDMASWDLPNFTKILKHADCLQIHNLYILVPSRAGFVIIDQHAAHERIIYERLLSSFQKKKERSKQYELRETIVLRLSEIQKQRFTERSNMLENIGILSETFGPDGIRISHIPELFKDHDIATLVTSLLDVDDVASTPNYIDEQSYMMLRFLACRSAIKAGDPLTKKQSKTLLEELDKTANNNTCPHGRPTKVLLTLKEIDRFFKRA